MCHAVGQATVNLRATRTVLLADGKQTTTLRAELRDNTGRYAPENTFVTFQVLNGGAIFSASQSPTHGGIATVTLHSASTGVVTVTATALGGFGTIQILFTDDPEATFQGNNYMLVTGSSYLAYSATDKAIEALGKNGGARVAYRNIEITADRLQLNCKDLILRARDNVTIKRAGKTLKATRLYYSLQSGDGYAIAPYKEEEADKDKSADKSKNNSKDKNTDKSKSTGEGRPQPVTIAGELLHVAPSKTPIPSSYMVIPEASGQAEHRGSEHHVLPGREAAVPPGALLPGSGTDTCAALLPDRSQLHRALYRPVPQCRDQRIWPEPPVLL